MGKRLHRILVIGSVAVNVLHLLRSRLLAVRVADIERRQHDVESQLNDQFHDVQTLMALEKMRTKLPFVGDEPPHRVCDKSDVY